MLHAFGNTRMKLVSGAVLLLLAGAANAQVATGGNFFGGGATLPAIGYAGPAAASVTDANKLVFPVSSGSFLGAFKASNSSAVPSYCETGSGAGKNILAGTSGTSVTNSCSGSTVLGFGAPSGSATQPQWVGSDSPLSVGDYNNYKANAAHSASGSEPVQLPAVSGAIALAFNNADIRSLALNETQVCQIFSGQITAWDDTRLASAITPISGHTVSGPIKVAYRSDGSGTSFSFANHLTAKCGTAANVDPSGSKNFLPNGSAPNFKTDQAWATAASAYLPSYVVVSGQPGIPASGNPAVANAIGANAGAIGYVEAANSSTSGLQIASVRNDRDSSVTSPATYGGTKLAVATVNDQVISGVTTGGRPNVVTLASQGVTPGVANCVKLVNPDNYAAPATGYPILAVSYALANAQGNGSQLSLVRNLMGGFYNTTIQSATTTIGTNKGLSFLTVTPAVTTTEVSRCITL